MNAAAVASDRSRRVRVAAREWRAAGVAGDDAVAAVDRLYPDDRLRFGLVMRLVLFVFTLVAVSAAAGLTFLVVDPGGVLVFLGAALWAVTELLAGAFRFHGGGADEATALSSVGFLCAGVAWVADKSGVHSTSTAVLVVGLALLCVSAAVAWRLGEPLFGGLAVVGLAVALTQAHAPRLAWLAVAGIAVPLLERLRHSRDPAPSHRDAAEVAIFLFAALAYFAANLWSFDARTLESFTSGVPAPVLFPRALAAALTALLPAAALAAGALRRDRMWLWVGALMTAASAVTLRHYWRVAPLWALLVAVGAVLGALALLLQRWLDAGPSRERRGVTARPLFERGLVEPAEIVAALATLAPAARPLPPESGFKPGGGTFGGGGASESF